MSDSPDPGDLDAKVTQAIRNMGIDPFDANALMWCLGAAAVEGHTVVAALLHGMVMSGEHCTGVDGQPGIRVELNARHSVEAQQRHGNRAVLCRHLISRLTALGAVVPPSQDPKRQDHG